MYNYAPNLDGDMIATAKNLNDAEDSLNYKWDIMALGLDSMHKHHKHHHRHSDPISGSLGFPPTEAKKKAAAKIVYYPDPDTMKLDGDIIHSHSSLENAEKSLEHKWKWSDE